VKSAENGLFEVASKLFERADLRYTGKPFMLSIEKPPLPHHIKSGSVAADCCALGTRRKASEAS